MHDVVTAALPAKQLLLHAHAACFKAHDGGDLTVITVDVDLPWIAAGRNVEYSIIGADDRGRVVASDEGASHVPRTNEALPLRIISALDIKPGLATIKAAVRTDDGLVGSVFLNIDVPRFSRHDLTISDVEIGAMPAGTLVLGMVPAFMSRALPVPPTTARAFRAPGTLAIYAEAYGVGSDDGGVATAIMAGPGNSRREVALTWIHRSSDTASREDAAPFVGTLDLHGLPAGKYRLEVQVRDGGRTRSRAIAFEIGLAEPGAARTLG